MKISPLAGKPAPLVLLIDVSRLITAYHTEAPDPHLTAQRVVFGTSGHRGSAFKRSFNEAHVLSITQAICLYRAKHTITGPLFLGIDTHALSAPACATALEVLAANGVEVMLAEGDEYTPTPVISHAILSYNRGRKSGLADGIVLTPSHKHFRPVRAAIIQQHASTAAHSRQCGSTTLHFLAGISKLTSGRRHPHFGSPLQSSDISRYGERSDDPRSTIGSL